MVTRGWAQARSRPLTSDPARNLPRGGGRGGQRRLRPHAPHPVRLAVAGRLPRARAAPPVSAQPAHAAGETRTELPSPRLVDGSGQHSGRAWPLCKVGAISRGLSGPDTHPAGPASLSRPSHERGPTAAARSPSTGCMEAAGVGQSCRWTAVRPGLGAPRGRWREACAHSVLNSFNVEKGVKTLGVHTAGHARVWPPRPRRRPQSPLPARMLERCSRGAAATRHENWVENAEGD